MVHPLHLGVTAVRGWFTRFTGLFEADRAQLGGATGEVSIDATSLTTSEEQRDAHLRSEDFFFVERYPTITFRLTGVRTLAENIYQVGGDLTIRGVTRPVTLEASMPGVLAAGDARHGSVKRVASAVGEGAVAAGLLHTLLADDRGGETTSAATATR